MVRQERTLEKSSIALLGKGIDLMKIFYLLRLLWPPRIDRYAIRFGHVHFPFFDRLWTSIYWRDVMRGDLAAYHELRKLLQRKREQHKNGH